MDATGIYENLKGKFGDQISELVTENPDPFIVVQKSSIADICGYLKEEPGFEFDFLRSISGVDTEEELELVYHLFSYKHRTSLTLKLRMAYDDIEVSTVEPHWKAADWHEREQFDLFGFDFNGHPDMRRLLLPEDWEGHPLLKNYEYPEEYHDIDHYRPDPLDQFKALDDLVAKAKEKKAEETASDSETETQEGEDDASESSEE